MTGKKRYSHHCPYCDKDFEGSKLQIYCCQAHKQAAFRVRQNPPMLQAINKQSAYRRMVETKAATIITLKCVGCGCEFTVTALQGEQTLYHNKACKQRCYRERKAERERLQHFVS